MTRIKLVVGDNHTLGYITHEQPNTLFTLRASVLKGSFGEGAKSTDLFDNIRLASEADFDEFNVCMTGYKNSNEYEFSEN